MDGCADSTLLMVKLWRLFACTALLLVCANALAHDPEKPNRHADRFEHYEGTGTCLECHEEEALTFFDSQHYQWRGGTPDLVNTTEAETLGKLTMVNDFCTNPGGSQWIGKVLNDEGKVLAKGCSGCHAGLGKLPGPEPTREQLENIDCLICHASGYRRDLYQSDAGEWQWRPILYKNQEGLDSVSKRISLPDRAMCLRCHSSSGGGPNFKRGDIEYILKDPDYEHDVHMSSKAEGGQDMWCIDCHADDEHTHRVIGRGVDMSATDSPGKTIDCGSQCHQQLTHVDTAIDKHGRLACPTCHIPEFARDEPTDMFRDWSTVHFDEEKGKYTYGQELEYDVEPVYAWFNGSSFAQVPGRPVQRNAKGEVTMIVPQGDRADASAKIAPFKLHRGVLPVLTEQQWIAPITTEELYHHGDPDKAVRDGTRSLYGLEEVDFTWEQTIRYMGIYHAIPPAGDALQCSDCHRQGGRMDWQALGYEQDPAPAAGSAAVAGQ
jgi:Cytochrome c bacterial